MGTAPVKTGIKAENIYDDPDRACRFDGSVLIREDGRRRAESMEVESSWTVLDIGAGPGTLALPLSRRVKAITAVEPSEAMQNILTRHLEEEGITTIRLLPRAWEEIDPDSLPPHDLVIASYSLLMEDWEGALTAMDRATLQRVDVYWFDGPTSWDILYGELYPPIFGREYIPRRKVSHILSILKALGREAEVAHLAGTSFPKTYRGQEEALADLRSRLGLSDGSFDGLLTDYIEKRFIRRGGCIVWPDATVYTRVSWRPAAS